MADEELTYWKMALHEMALQPFWLRQLTPSNPPLSSGAALIFLPEWVDGQVRIDALRNLARKFAQSDAANDLERGTFPEMAMQTIACRDLVPSTATRPGVAAIVLMPDWIAGATLDQVLRDMGRAIGQRATQFEEELRRLPGDGNGGSPRAMMAGFGR